MNNQGWQCPVCGGGVAPTVERCPCVALDRVQIEPTTGCFGTMDSNDGWIEWKGGKCPVPADAMVEIRTEKYGTERSAARAYVWKHDGVINPIIAYKVLP